MPALKKLLAAAAKRSRVGGQHGAARTQPVADFVNPLPAVLARNGDMAAAKKLSQYVSSWSQRAREFRDSPYALRDVEARLLPDGLGTEHSSVVRQLSAMEAPAVARVLAFAALEAPEACDAFRGAVAFGESPSKALPPPNYRECYENSLVKPAVNVGIGRRMNQSRHSFFQMYAQAGVGAVKMVSRAEAFLREIGDANGADAVDALLAAAAKKIINCGFFGNANSAACYNGVAPKHFGSHLSY